MRGAVSDMSQVASPRGTPEATESRPRIVVFGQPEPRVVRQLERCLVEDGSLGVLCGDAHFGYSQPIGGVVAYPDHISPSGCGYDIACGNKAARTSLKVTDVDIVRVMDEIKATISFGLGRINAEPVDDPVLESIAHAGFGPQQKLLKLASEQLGTVGSGNHYVDLLEDDEGYLWVGVHFGSRGFGHRTATGFLALAQRKSFEDNVREGEMDSPPILLDARMPLGQDYVEAMRLAGEYAYAGRNWVVARVLKILGTAATYEVHAHHNFAWREKHFGQDFWVVRKGATPAFPGQQGFVGGSMGDISVVLEGIDSDASKSALYSTVHGAGRIMSRTQAAGRSRWKHGRKERIGKGLVDWDAVNQRLKADGIVIRGGEADEAPQVYRPLKDVLEAHQGTVKILHTLRPKGVAMAGRGDGYDPYKD